MISKPSPFLDFLCVMNLWDRKDVSQCVQKHPWEEAEPEAVVIEAVGRG